MPQALAAADAERIIGDILALPFATTPSVELLAEAHRLAVAHGRTVYDALYLALSVRRGCPFVTADERLVNAVAGPVDAAANARVRPNIMIVSRRLDAGPKPSYHTGMPASSGAGMPTPS